MKTRKCCWTCKARKVQCDGGLPTCERCARARRECQGYEMRLSWPRDDDKRRSITAGSQPMVTFASQGTNSFFINTTMRDIELYRHLSLQTQPFHLVQTPPDLWRLPQLRVDHLDLLQYFHSCAYLSLVTFTATASLRLRDALIRMAQAHERSPGLALFYALLAFSSLHRNGLHQQAMQFKIAALHSLSASAKDCPLSSAEAAQHVAASMLLGAFEILLPVESSGEWLWYIWGAMDMIQAAQLTDRSHESDIGHLLDWVYYHNALSRFPTHHWFRKSLNPEATDSNHSPSRGLQSPSLARHRPAPPSPNPTYAILNLLSEACDSLPDPWNPRGPNEEYHDRLLALEERTGNLPIIPTPPSSGTDAAGSVEVYQLATRIYLLRASQGPLESSARLDSLVDKAFAVPTRGHYCPHFFPLFIVACEARTDERRASILSLIDRNERDERRRSMKGLKLGIQSIWVQQDLHADADLLVDYLATLSAVISSSSTFPSFA